MLSLSELFQLQNKDTATDNTLELGIKENYSFLLEFWCQSVLQISVFRMDGDIFVRT